MTESRRPPIRLAGPARALAVLGVVGAASATLAGCASAAAVDESYTDGTYTADGSYVAPSGQESITVELTLKNDIVTDVTVTPRADDPRASDFQTQFARNIADEVVGKDIDRLSVSRVAGSSLTSAGFAKAIDAIKAEAVES